MLDHRNEERHKPAQLQGERWRFAREVAAKQLFWQKHKLDMKVESVVSCIANIPYARVFHFVSLLPPKRLMVSAL